MHASLTYLDVHAAAAWLHQTFGFDARLADNGIGILSCGNDRVIVQPDQPSELHGGHLGQGWVYTVVEHIDAHYQRALRACAQLLGPPHDDGGNLRGYSARDLKDNL